MKELKPFIKLAKQVDSTDEFIDKARQLQVPYEVSDWFASEYGAGTMLTPEKATEYFIEDVKAGKFDYVTNAYLYRREEYMNSSQVF